MAGFDDLIPAAMPYMATEKLTATAGTDWQWDYRLLDDAGDPVDVGTGFTRTMKLVDQTDGTVVYTPTVTQVSTGLVRCTLDATTTASDPGSKYDHELTITRTSDSKKIIVVGAGDAEFVVKKKVS